MELTKESILIKNDYSNYPFRLEMDDIKGYIRLTKNTDKETTRITTRNIPISTNTKWYFHNNRHKYCEKSKGDPFNGSAILRSINPVDYSEWKSYMYDQYKFFKREEII